MAGSDGSGQAGVALAERSAAPPLEEEMEAEKYPPASPPAAFLCPISLTLMADPVLVVPTGQTYERSSIEAWLASHSTCPATGQRLQRPVPLVPVFALRSAIEEWARRHAPQLLDQEGHVQPQGDCPGPFAGNPLPCSGDISSTPGGAAALPPSSQRTGGSQVAGQQRCVGTAPASAAGFYYPTAVGALLMPSAGGSAREGSGRGLGRPAVPRISAAPLLAQPASSSRARRAASNSRSMAARREERGAPRAEYPAQAAPSSRQGQDSVAEAGRAAQAPRITAAPLLLPPPQRSAAGQVGSGMPTAAQHGHQQPPRSSIAASSSSRGSYVLPPAQLYRRRSGGLSREREAVPVQQQLSQSRPAAPSQAAASPPGHSGIPEGVRTPARHIEGGQRQERPAMLYPAPLLLPRKPKPPSGNSGGLQGAGARRAANVRAFHEGQALPVIVGAPLVPGQVVKKRGGCAIQ